jgi:hypothetical protein
MAEVRRRHCWHEDKENHMILLLSRTGLRYDEKAIASGAQTERRGGAGSVRGIRGGKTSPAAFV